MDGMITRAEHEEFRKRLDAENARQNERLDELEETVHQINALTISVEKMAISILMFLNNVWKMKCPTFSHIRFP